MIDQISDEWMIWITLVILGIFILPLYTGRTFIDPILEYRVFGLIQVITAFRIVAIISFIKMWKRQI